MQRSSGVGSTIKRHPQSDCCVAEIGVCPAVCLSPCGRYPEVRAQRPRAGSQAWSAQKGRWLPSVVRRRTNDDPYQHAKMGSTEQKNEANVAIITGGTVSDCFFFFLFQKFIKVPDS